MQLMLCASVRDRCAPPVACMLSERRGGGAQPADQGKATDALAELRRRARALYDGREALSADVLRSWLATEGASLFAPLP